MQLIKIEIEKYKSIVTPVCIHFQKGLPTVLIGKNGSGKSNVLEALEHIASTNANLPGKHRAGGLRYKAYVCLEKEEFEKLFPDEDYSENKATFTACSSSKNTLYIDTIESESIVPLLKKELVNIRSIADELNAAIEDYEKILQKIACEDWEALSLRGYELIDGKGNTTNYEPLKFRASFFANQVKQLADEYTDSIKSEHVFVFSHHYYDSKILFDPHAELIPFELKYKKPALAPFEQKFITINETAIKREITKINKKTANIRQRTNDLIAKLKTQSERLMGTDHSYGAITEFIRNACHIFGANCGYLVSESSQVLFKNPQKEYDLRYHNPSHIVFEAYAKATKKSWLLEDKDHTLSDAELKEFERWLNDNRPTFDHGMYKSITVSLREKNEPIIKLIENNGQIVLLDETSAGRRWYFTYYFIKCTLSAGDVFIIDEPASMLHPTAQKEILTELLELSRQGIHVIYSTHSPYLIPEDWRCVSFTDMAKDGTKVTKVDFNSNEFKQFRASSPIDIFSYQEIVEYFNKSKFQKKITKGICNKLLDKYTTHSEIAKALKIDERTCYYWQNAEKLISIHNILKASLVLEMDPLMLIKKAEE